MCAYVLDLESAELLGAVDDLREAGPWACTEVLGGLDALVELAKQPLQYVTALGSNEKRRELVERIEALGLSDLSPWTLVHPSAHVGPDVTLGVGTLLAPGVIVTTQARIGRHCILNARATVHHDCVLEDFVNLNPGVTLCGNVRVGEGASLGAGATVLEKVTVGRGAVVGAGAVVIRDLPDGVTAVGVPARVVKGLTP